MTVPVWPTQLPRPEQDTWNKQPQDPRKARQSEAGPPGFQRRFSSVARIVTLSVALDRNENAIFDRFHQETAYGSLPFLMPDPTTDGWALLTSAGEPVLISGGPNHGKPILLAKLWLCSFGKRVPDETIKGVTFTRTFELVVYP